MQSIRNKWDGLSNRKKMLLAIGTGAVTGTAAGALVNKKVTGSVFKPAIPHLWAKYTSKNNVSTKRRKSKKGKSRKSRKSSGKRRKASGKRRRSRR